MVVATGGRAKRADATRNRERILRAAFQVFSDVGVDAQMADVAEHAGLGVGTLYRNFPSKEALVNALLFERLSLAAASVARAARHPDAWAALCELVQLITVRQLENRVLSQFLGGRIVGSPELSAQRDAVYGVIEGLLERAKAEGALRPDVNIADVRLVMTAVAHVAASDAPLAHRLVARHVAIVMDGLRSGEAHPLIAAPLSLAESEALFSYP